MRSRAVSLPLACCAEIRCSPPPGARGRGDVPIGASICFKEAAPIRECAAEWCNAARQSVAA